jgi:aminocarboxymuconate-semialdehyde decarboxylase
MATGRVPAIDMHAHTIMPEIEALVRGKQGWREDHEQRASFASAASAEHNRHLNETLYRPRFASLDNRLALMDQEGVDIQAVSTAPTANYWYFAGRDLAPQVVEINNRTIAEMCQKKPDRLIGLGIVSLQHPDLAVTQLEHAMGDLKLRGIITSTLVGGKDLADPSFEPVWAKAEELGAVIFIHPAGCAIDGRLTSYYLSNVIGNPLETTIALTHLIFSGTLDRHPRLKIVAAHGGGYLPFYTHRFDHGWKVRPEAHTCRLAPSEYLRRIWFDSLVYQPDLLANLIKRVGASQVVLGTDYPFDMGVENPRECLAAVPGLSNQEIDAITGGNAAGLLGLEIR